MAGKMNQDDGQCADFMTNKGHVEERQTENNQMFPSMIYAIRQVATDLRFADHPILSQVS